MTLFRAKRSRKRLDRLDKQLIKFQNFVKKIKGWIKEEEKKLQRLLNNLSKDDTLKYGVQTGFITENEFDKLMKKK